MDFNFQNQMVTARNGNDDETNVNGRPYGLSFQGNNYSGIVNDQFILNNPAGEFMNSGNNLYSYNSYPGASTSTGTGFYDSTSNGFSFQGNNQGLGFAARGLSPLVGVGSQFVNHGAGGFNFNNPASFTDDLNGFDTNFLNLNRPVLTFQTTNASSNPAAYGLGTTTDRFGSNYGGLHGARSGSNIAKTIYNPAASSFEPGFAGNSQTTYNHAAPSFDPGFRGGTPYNPDNSIHAGVAAWDPNAPTPEPRDTADADGAGPNYPSPSTTDVTAAQANDAADVALPRPVELARRFKAVYKKVTDHENAVELRRGKYSILASRYRLRLREHYGRYPLTKPVSKSNHVAGRRDIKPKKRSGSMAYAAHVKASEVQLSLRSSLEGNEALENLLGVAGDELAMHGAIFEDRAGQVEEWDSGMYEWYGIGWVGEDMEPELAEVEGLMDEAEECVERVVNMLDVLPRSL